MRGRRSIMRMMRVLFGIRGVGRGSRFSYWSLDVVVLSFVVAVVDVDSIYVG